MKHLLLILFAALTIGATAQTVTYTNIPYIGTFTVTHWPYPGTVTVALDGDLVRITTSLDLTTSGYTLNTRYREWYINPYGGGEEVSEQELYVNANLLSTNAGINAFTPQIRIPMRLVQHQRTDGTGISTQYLASIKGDTLFTNGRKYGFTDKWSIKLTWAKIDQATLTATSYETDWIPVNIASLPAQDASVFYAGTVFNPVQPTSPTSPGKGVKKK